MIDSRHCANTDKVAVDKGDVVVTIGSIENAGCNEWCEDEEDHMDALEIVPVISLYVLSDPKVVLT